MLKSPMEPRRQMPPVVHPQNTDPIRAWVRRKGETPTSVMVMPYELVDDFKLKVLSKYPVSLLRSCDPSNLDIVPALKLQQQPSDNAPHSPHSATRPQLFRRRTPGLEPERRALPGNEGTSTHLKPELAPHRKPAGPEVPSVRPNLSGTPLRPDEDVYEIIKRLYPRGMAMTDALELQIKAVDLNPVAGSSENIHKASNSLLLPTKPPFVRQNTRSSRASKPEADIDHYSRKPGSDAAAAAAAAAAAPSPRAITPIQTLPDVAKQPASENTQSQTSQSVRSATSKKASPVQQKKPSALANSTKAPAAEANVLLLPRQIKPASSTTAEKRNSADDLDIDQSTGNETMLNNASLALHGLEALRKDRNETATQNLSFSLSEVTVVPHIKVLIVEDNVINQKILEAFMRRKHISFGAARNGREAVDKWRQGGYHIILMDIQLPVMTGLEATKEIRRLEFVNRIGAFSSSEQPKQPLTPEDKLDRAVFKSPIIIVALTASSASEDKSGALAAGCNDFLTKPVNLLWLEQKITEWGCMQALIDFDGWKQWVSRSEQIPALPKKPSQESKGEPRKPRSEPLPKA